MAAVVNELGAEKVEQVIFVACCVPMPGQSVIDTLPFGLRQIVRRCVARSPVIDALPFAVTRFCFGNRTTREQRARIRANFCRESSALLTDPTWLNLVHTAAADFEERVAEVVG